MEEYVYIGQNEEESVYVYFDVGHEKPMQLGAKMEEINEEAYMNGYNWESLIFHYLSNYEPTLMTLLSSDSESGTFVAFYDYSLENVERANKLAELISSLVEEETKLLQIVEKEDVEWD